MKFINDLNLRKQAENLGVKIWQTPGFLFIILGLVAAIIMAATYFISKNYDSPQVLVISESIVATVILAVGSSIINLFEQVARINKMKSEFVSVASHQLRTPISAIKWSAELLLEKYNKGLSKKQISDVKNIFDLVCKMNRLVSDLLDVTRIDQNRMIFRKKKFDFKKIVKETINESSILVKKRNIEVNASFKKELSLGFGDPDKIKLVVENLLSNAIKYTPSGGKVDIRLFEKDHFFVFEIKDTGVGIPEEQLKRVFEKFFRSDNAARYQTEGTGLGLYIAKNIIEQSGGKIWFNSIEDIGSVFSFSLPCHNGKMAEIMKA